MIETRKRYYSTPELVRLTGFTFRQLDYWCRNGYVEPRIDAAGSGTQRRWSKADALVLLVLARAYNEKAGGISPRSLRNLWSELHEVLAANGTLGDVVVTDGFNLLASGPFEIVAEALKLKRGAVATIIRVDDLMDSLADAA